MDPILDRIRRTVARHQLWLPGARLGVAVSGGADSVCLLHALLALRDEGNLQLHVVHLDHRLRPESAADADFVRGLADRHALPFHLERVDVAARGGNLEQEARQARLHFFERLIAQGEVDRIATGHTQSDQAETVLFRILRGAGLSGLAGILPKTESGLVRPLLDISRPQVEQWLAEHNLSWVEDRTNRDLAFTRNRIRWELLPALARTYNPALTVSLSQLAALARDEESYWAEFVAVWLERYTEAGKHGSRIAPCPPLRHLPLAAARRCLRALFQAVKGDLLGIEFTHIEHTLGLVHQTEGSGRLQAPGLDVFRSFDSLRVMPAGAEPPFNRMIEVVLAVPGLTRLPEGPVIETRLWESRYTGSEEEQGWELAIYDSIRLPLRLRYWLPGDRYQPGMAPSCERDPQKIKEMFQLARIPLWERRSWPIIEGGDGNILWSRRFGVAARFRPDGGNSRILGIREP